VISAWPEQKETISRKLMEMDNEDDCETYSEVVVDDDDSECVYPSDEEEEIVDNDKEEEVHTPNCFLNITTNNNESEKKNSIEKETADFEAVVKKARFGSMIICDVEGIRSQYYNRLIDEIGKLLSISADESLALLLHFKWNKEKIQEAYFDNADKVRKTVGIDLYRPYVKQQKSVAGGANSDDESGCLICCGVCYDEVPPSSAVSLGCDHAFCVDCFRTYLATQVGNGPPGCLTTKCPSFKCTQLVPHSYFRGLLSHSEASSQLLEKQEAYCLRNYIENSRSMNFCRAAHCELISVATSSAHVDEVVNCPCGHRYCFKCGEEPHQPCSCSQLSTWNDKCSNESETTNWIMANTKKCPKCAVRIEKNQGCNHMTCKHCNHHFCWLCFGELVFICL